MIERPTILRELMNASILLAFVTSLLYLSGASYINSYLTQWGVESNLITPNIQEVLVLGASIWFFGGLYIVIPALILGIALLFYSYMLSDLSRSPLVRKIASSIYDTFKRKETEELKPPGIIQSIKGWSLQFVVFFAFLLIFLFLFGELLKFSSSQAVERAENEYIEFSSGRFSDTRIFSRKKILTISGVKREGYILASSDSMLVLYLLPKKSKGEEVVVIPLSLISEIKAEKNAT